MEKKRRRRRQWDGAGEMRETERERNELRLTGCVSTAETLAMYEYESAFLWTDGQCNAGSKYELQVQGRRQWRTCIDLSPKLALGLGLGTWDLGRGRDVGMH